ncbi:MAG TPA: hypothetical protein VFA04_24360 [Bryobacteraceae bacterium]|nr:hypothetical protein [Bryobacteraceae bacterium]
MASYISSNNNRLYVGVEPAYGIAASVSAANLTPLVSLSTSYKLQRPHRKDKTGTRTYMGEVSGVRRSVDFELRSYLCSWGDTTQAPPHGALVQAALGGTPLAWGGKPVASVNGSTVTFSSAHGLIPGQAVCWGGEIRFVSAIASESAVQINAPFTGAVAAGAAGSPTMTYMPAEELPSATMFDYWSPGTAVQRVVSGAAIGRMTIGVNGDFHDLTFRGSAADLVDSGSFEAGQAGLSELPAEPAPSMVTYSLVAGNLGQAWMGVIPWQAFTVTSAQITVDNDLELRDQEFGFTLARGISPGARTISATLSLFAQDDAGVTSLYQAARQRSPISIMLQLGQQQGQLMGIYLKSVVPEVPSYDDGQRRLQWKFQNSRAQGGANDELYIGFA